MTLAPLRLDDLTWDDMVAAIRRRIPAESAGNWTLHAPVDPGITLLELFAWLAEQRLYWLDQVPDAFVVAVLKLLGLDGPRPAVPAATVLRIAAADSEKPAAFTVPAGTGFTRDLRGEVVFTLDVPVTVLPIRNLTLVADGQDRTADLLVGREVALLPAGGGPGEARISLDLTAPVPGGQLSLLIDLATPAPPRPARLRPPGPRMPPTTCRRPPSSPGPTTTATRGTDRYGPGRGRHPGTATLRHRPAPRPGVLEPGRRGAILLLSTEPGDVRRPATAAAAPGQRRRGPAPAATSATTPRTPWTTQVSRWLPLPGQHLDLPDAQGRLLDASLTLRERDGTEHQWTAVADFVFSGREDRVFVIDRTAGALRFGDGRTGRIPVPDPASAGESALAWSTWTLGGGTGGNGGRTANWRSTGGAVNATAANLVPGRGRRGSRDDRAGPRPGRRRHDTRCTARSRPPITRRSRGRPRGWRWPARTPRSATIPATPAPSFPQPFPSTSCPTRRAATRDWDRPDFVPAPAPIPACSARSVPRCARRGCSEKSCSSGNPATARPGCGWR